MAASLDKLAGLLPLMAAELVDGNANFPKPNVSEDCAVDADVTGIDQDTLLAKSAITQNLNLSPGQSKFMEQVIQAESSFSKAEMHLSGTHTYISIGMLISVFLGHFPNIDRFKNYVRYTMGNSQYVVVFSYFELLTQAYVLF